MEIDAQDLVAESSPIDAQGSEILAGGLEKDRLATRRIQYDSGRIVLDRPSREVFSSRPRSEESASRFPGNDRVSRKGLHSLDGTPGSGRLTNRRSPIQDLRPWPRIERVGQPNGG